MNYIAGQMASDRVNWSAPLAMDPVDPSMLYFGTYRVWKTTDQGNNWTPVSGDLTKGGSNYFHSITTIAVSHVNSSIVVVGCGDGFGVFVPYILMEPVPAAGPTPPSV